MFNCETALAQLSTDDKIITGDNESLGSNVPTGIFIPQHMVSWGGRSSNKTPEKAREREMASKLTRKTWKEASNPQFKSRGEI